jgi:hypothetical protein
MKIKVRTVVVILVLLLSVSCGVSSRNSELSLPNSDIAASIVGSWDVVHMSQSPVPLEDIPQSKLVSGRLEFKRDGTFEGAVTMHSGPEETRLVGTYQVDGDVITIHNSLNNSTTKSKARLVRDYLVLEPVTREALSYIFYYRRIK